MLTDEVKIIVEAGRGGDGIVSFHHEKFAPKGGPDGGDGGRGADVIFMVDKDTNMLNFFDMRKKFKGSNGENGKKNRATGKSASNLILKVPRGTIIYNVSRKSKKKIKDLNNFGQKLIIAKGGKGGWGNCHFATATHQTPKEANLGRNGEKKDLLLELELIADVGIIGLPNAGKSTLLARITHARPKIADYPFTTLEPNLGVAEISGFSFVVADIPGLIEGASKGKGLGHKFLRHIKRTRVLIHLLDSTRFNLLDDYHIIREELKKFSPSLIHKPEIVVVSKVDMVSEKEQRRLYNTVSKFHPIFLSSLTGRGIKDLLYEIKKILTK